MRKLGCGVGWLRVRGKSGKYPNYTDHEPNHMLKFRTAGIRWFFPRLLDATGQLQIFCLGLRCDERSGKFDC